VVILVTMWHLLSDSEDHFADLGSDLYASALARHEFRTRVVGCITVDFTRLLLPGHRRPNSDSIGRGA
jgi:hypothetical protein